MTKQEKIKEEWIALLGEENAKMLKLDKIDTLVSINGFLRRHMINSHEGNGMGYEDLGIAEDKVDFVNEHHGNYSWRPLALRGIEKNRNWIKIESEADLPKIEGNYWVIDRFLESNPSKEHWEIAPIVSLNERWMHRFTHYQPLEKPQLPIY